MRERLLNHTPLYRKLRQLLVLIVLLLTPIGAWAEDYPVKIGSTQLTDANIGNYSGVEYDPSTKKLILNGAKLTECIFWLKDFDFTIALKGKNSITSSSGSCIENNYVTPSFARQKARKKAPGSNISFVKDDSSSDPCSLTLICPDGNNVIDGFTNSGSPTMGTGLFWLSTKDDNNKITSAIVTTTVLGGGEGTQESPFIINTYEHLKQFADYINSGMLTTEYVRLGDDVDCSSKTDFEVIGLPNDFKGHFDGNGKAIKNLNIKFLGDAPVGLFSKINGGTVENLTLSSCSFSGKEYTGGIAGDFSSGTIKNCNVKACTIENEGDYAGAIVGNKANDITLSINFYDADVTVKINTNSDPTTKSGQTQRGIGNGDDEIDKAMLAGTKTLKVTVLDGLSGGEYTIDEDSYYLYAAGTGFYYVLQNETFKISAYTSVSHKPTLTLSDQSIDVTSEEKMVDGSYDHTEFSFTMPGADVTATLAFPINLSADGITATIDDVDYIGSAIEPTTVKVAGISGAAGITELTNGTDFTINSYSLNGASVDSPVNAGTYKVTIEGQGNYIGIIGNIDYTIAKIDIAKCEISDNNLTETYKGSKYEPTFIVTSPTSTLTLNTDYTVAYYKVENGVVGTTSVDMIEVGEYRIVISGKGNYGGTNSYDFEITKANLSIVTIEAIKDQTYTGSEIKPEIKVTLNDVTLTPDDYGYTVGYSNNTNVPASGATSVPTVTLTALAASKYFTEGTTQTATFNIVPKSIEGVTVTLSGDGFDSEKKCFVYNGQNQAPTVTVKDGDKLLILDTDYTLSNNGGVGVADDYSVTVTGKDNYDEGTSVDVTYSIAPRSIAETTINLDATVTYVYTGGEHEPEPVVKYGDTELVKDQDYTLSYSNNINAAASTAENAPTITITGKGNFDENTTTKVKFTIGQADLATAAISKISFGGTDYTAGDAAIEIPYTGEAIHPTVKEVKFNDGTITLDASEYEVSWGNHNTEHSSESESAQVIITSTGKNFMAGTSTSLNFKIVAANVTISAPDQTVTYNGSTQAYTSATVDNTNATLAVAYYTKEDDRTKGSNALAGAPTDAGTYYVRVTQTNNNFTADAKNATFTIGQLSLTGAVITLEDDELEYNGTELTATVTKVMVGDIEVPAASYEVSGNKQTDPGEYTLTVTAKANGGTFTNNFKGSATATFTIKRNTAEINFPAGLTYMTYYNADIDLFIPDGVTAYVVTGTDGATVTVTKVTYLKSGVPLLLEKTDGSTVVMDPNDSFDGNKLVYVSSTVTPSGQEYVLYNNEFVKAAGTIPVGKVYLKVDDSSAARVLMIGDDTTDIDILQIDNLQIDNWYDLQGRRIDKPTKKGLYILNGKKTVIK